MSGFSEKAMREKLQSMTQHQESIQTISLWLRHHSRHHSDAIVQVWLKEVRREVISKKIVNLLYLANDTIQNSRKSDPILMQKFFGVFEAAFRHATKISGAELDKAVARLLEIWTQRQIYTKEQLEKLTAASKHHAPATATSTNIFPSSTNSVNKVTYDSEAISKTSKDIMESLKKIEDPPSANGAIRHRIASYPETLATVSMTERIRNEEEADDLLKQIEEANPVVTDYCKNLALEMLDRRNLQTQIDMFISHIKATVENQEKLIRDVKRTEDRLKIELAEIRRAYDSLPDLNEVPDVSLPTLEALFEDIDVEL